MISRRMPLLAIESLLALGFAVLTTPALAPPAGPPPPKTCKAWTVTYDMKGTTFDIRDTPFGMGDQINRIGPGRMSIRFADRNGAPGPGKAQLLRCQSDVNFTINSVGAKVVTDLDFSAGTNPCGIAVGNFDGRTLSWSGARAIGQCHSQGTVTCSGAGCRLGSVPAHRDINETWRQPLRSFRLPSGVSKFNAPEVEVPNKGNATTWLKFVGTEVRRELGDAPACFCP
jgi:hypothetical protein